MYEEIILNCFRYLNFTRLYDIEVLSLEEYSYQIKAYQLKQIDKQHDMHLQAWLNQAVQATKSTAGGKKSEPYYKNFKSFFDYDKRLKEIGEPQKNKTKTLSQSHRDLARRAAQVNHD